MTYCFKPAFSPRSCYMLRNPEEERYFEHYGGAPEAKLIQWAAESLIHIDEVFVDVGAHVGSWAQHLAQRCRRVIAFEPQSSTFNRLVEGVSRAVSITNIIPFPVALGRCRGKRTLSIVSTDGGGSTLLHRSELGSVLAQQEVDVWAFDDYGIGLGAGRIGLVKLDVEGYELDALIGMRRTLEEHRWPHILAEAWLHDWYKGERAVLRAHLMELGYFVEEAPGWPEMLWAHR